MHAIGINVVPISDAAKWGHLHCQILGQRQVDRCSIYCSESALEAAEGDLDILYFLEEQSSQIDCSLLYHACLDGRDEIVEYLLSTGKMEPHTCLQKCMDLEPCTFDFSDVPILSMSRD